MDMTSDVVLTFCLPAETDEGICPLALLRYLKEIHNNFCRIVNEKILLAHPFSNHEDIVPTAVSSNDFTASNSICYNLEGDIIPFIEKRCVSIDEDGSLHYDLKKVERRLLTKNFSTLREIQLEVALFEFVDEQHLGGLAPLRQKVHQQPLPPDTEAAIRREVNNPAQASRCLEILETAISFLGATGRSSSKSLDASVEDMEMSQYLQTFLLIKESTDAWTRSVQLKHLEGLWDLLNEIAEIDPFEGVSKRYCEPLPERLLQKLRQKAREMDLQILCPVLKRFISSQLKEEIIDKDSSSKEAIKWCSSGSDENFLSDFLWFRNWPCDLPIKHLVDTYKVLERISAS